MTVDNLSNRDTISAERNKKHMATKKRITDKVYIYSTGLVYCSVCALKTVATDEIEKIVERGNPTGIESKWKIAKESFADGVANPSPCLDDDKRMHYLLVC